MDILKLLMVAILIGLTAFFVAVEFAIIKVRSSRIDQLVSEKRRGALAAKKVTSNLDEYLSACQLGITITALGLGWLGEPTIKHLLEPLFLKLTYLLQLQVPFHLLLLLQLLRFYMLLLVNLLPKRSPYKEQSKLAYYYRSHLFTFTE